MAISYEQAVEVLSTYFQRHPLDDPDYREVVTTGRPVTEGWYFPTSIEHTGNLECALWEEFAGAQGYIVSRETGLVRVVGMREFRDRHSELTGR